VGGFLFILVGAWLAAWITFAFGTLAALVAAVQVRHHDPRLCRDTSAHAPADAKRRRR
jgi:hypothetical protein